MTLALAREMLALSGITGEDPAARLADGSAYETYRSMIAAQGGDPDAEMSEAGTIHRVLSTADGTVARLDAMGVGLAAWRLGAGRARKEDAVSPRAGVLCLAKPGETVVKGQPILELHTDDPATLAHALAALDGAIDVVDGPVEAAGLVLERIDS